jgi:hypothetical protein
MAIWSSVFLTERLRKTQEQPLPRLAVCFWVLVSSIRFYRSSTTTAVLPGKLRQSESGTKIFAFVADDPDTLFQVAVVSGTTVISGVGITAIGNNGTLVQNAGSTTTGNSAVALLDSTATTNTLPIRIIDVVRETETTADNVS